MTYARAGEKGCNLFRKEENKTDKWKNVQKDVKNSENFKPVFKRAPI